MKTGVNGWGTTFGCSFISVGWDSSHGSACSMLPGLLPVEMVGRRVSIKRGGFVMSSEVHEVRKVYRVLLRDHPTLPCFARTLRPCFEM